MLHRPVSAIVAAILLGSLAAAPALAQPTPSSGPGLLGAADEAWRDDFTTLTTWEILSDEVGTTVHDAAAGRLVVTVTADRSTVWDDHVLDAAHPVLRVEARVAVGGAGAAGVACGSSLGLARWLWASVDDLGDWTFGRLIDGRLQVLQRGELPVAVGAPGTASLIAIECAADPEAGGDRAVVSIDGIPVTTAFDIPVGPYDRATILVSSDAAPVEGTFDDLLVHVGSSYLPPAQGSLPGPGFD
ncbi:MAG: hypothetical protein ACKOTZ_02190 [Chloroflexota bacterium]